MIDQNVANPKGTAPSPFQLRPNPDGSTTVELLVDAQSVSRATIIPMTIRIGAATVRMDGIGGVATDDAHRYQGYSRRVLEFVGLRVGKRNPGVGNALTKAGDFARRPTGRRRRF